MPELALAAASGAAESALHVTLSSQQVLHNHFRVLEVLNAFAEDQVPLWKRAAARMLQQSRSGGSGSAGAGSESGEGSAHGGSAHGGNAASAAAADGIGSSNGTAGGDGGQPVSHTALRNAITGLYEVAPCIDGRITCVG